MMNRREILGAAAAGTAVFAGIPNVRAATYDLVIKGGRVIDPSVGLDGIRDVAIAGGRIAAIDANIAGDATDTIDARGKIVTPGLIDIHTHAGRGKDSPALAMQDCVTGLVDAGSGGLAVGVHTTQFAIREIGLYEPVLGRAMETARSWTDRKLVMIAKGTPSPRATGK